MQRSKITDSGGYFYHNIALPADSYRHGRQAPWGFLKRCRRDIMVEKEMQKYQAP
jgi:hypothetical protein